MKNKTDLRVIKTRKLLYDSLLTLMEDKPFEEIKVSDICEHALINRSTFYAHYSDKYELFSSYIENLKLDLATELEKNTSITNSKEYYLEMLSLFFNHVEEKRNVYLAIGKQNRNSIVMDMIYNTFSEDIAKSLDNSPIKAKNKIPSSFITSFYLGAIFGIGIEWITNNNKYTKKELIEYLKILIPDDLNNSKKEN